MQNMNNQINHQPSSRDVFYVLFKHKKKITFFFLSVMGVIIFGTYISQKIYRSEAKLFIKLGRETVTSDSDSTPGQRIQISQTLENQINSEIEILKSQELVQKTAEILGVDLFLENSEKYKSLNNSLNDQLRRKVQSIIELPKTAFARLLPSSSIPDSGSFQQTTELASKAISNNLQAQVVKDSNIIKISFESYNPFIARDVLNQIIELYLEKHARLIGTPGSFEFFQKEATRFKEQLETTEKQIQELKNEIGSGYESGAIAELNDGLHSLKLKEQELLSTFTEISIPVQEIRRQIRKTENQLEEQLKSNNEAEVYLVQLERQKELLEKNYRKYADTLEQTRIDKALEAEKISNIKIAQAPYVPLEPIRPRAGLNILLGFIISLFGSLGLAFFIEYMDGSLQKPQQIEEALEIPVLGSIQEMRK